MKEKIWVVFIMLCFIQWYLDLSWRKVDPDRQSKINMYIHSMKPSAEWSHMRTKKCVKRHLKGDEEGMLSFTDLLFSETGIFTSLCIEKAQLNHVPKVSLGMRLGSALYLRIILCQVTTLPQLALLKIKAGLLLRPCYTKQLFLHFATQRWRIKNL